MSSNKELDMQRKRLENVLIYLRFVFDNIGNPLSSKKNCS